MKKSLKIFQYLKNLLTVLNKYLKRVNDNLIFLFLNILLVFTSFSHRPNYNTITDIELRNKKNTRTRERKSRKDVEYLLFNIDIVVF